MRGFTGGTQRRVSRLVDEVVYQLFGHFFSVSIVLLVIFVGLGLLSGYLLFSMALGAFVWAIVAVGCAKYCEFIADQKGDMRL